MAEPRRRAGSAIAYVAPPLVVLAALIGAWYVEHYRQSPIRRFIWPKPHVIVQRGFLEWNNLSTILAALWESTKVAAIGLSIAVVIGLLLAVAMSQARVVERAFFPFLVTLQAVPILALTPLIRMRFGTGQGARIVVCVMISFFPIMLNALFGLHSASGGLHDLVTLHRGGRWVRLRKVMLPSALPAMFAGLRIAAGLSVIGAIVGDMLFGQGRKGLGQLIRQWTSPADSPLMFAAVITSSLLGIVVFLTFGWLQQRLIGRWHDVKTGTGR